MSERLGAIMDRVMNALFPCFHRKLTKPITLKSKGTYVTCLSCGRKFEYDWTKMRVVWKKGR